MYQTKKGSVVFSVYSTKNTEPTDIYKTETIYYVYCLTETLEGLVYVVLFLLRQFPFLYRHLFKQLIYSLPLHSLLPFLLLPASTSQSASRYHAPISIEKSRGKSKRASTNHKTADVRSLPTNQTKALKTSQEDGLLSKLRKSPIKVCQTKQSEKEKKKMDGRMDGNIQEEAVRGKKKNEEQNGMKRDKRKKDKRTEIRERESEINLV